MRLVESRQPGFGYLILQHQDYAKGPDKYTLDMRPSIMGVRITGRMTSQPGALGHYIHDPETVGDIICSTCWKTSGKGSPPRRIAGWSWAWPAVMMSKKSADDEPPQPSAECSQRPKDPDGKSTLRAYPLRVDEFLSGPGGKKTLPRPDFRFAGMQPIIVGAKPEELTEDTYGILLSAVNEERQHELFFPLGGSGLTKLIAVHSAGDRNMGTLVYDTTEKWELDDNLKARLQSLVWVIQKPIQKPEVECDLGKENFLALNLHVEGCNECNPDDGCGAPVIGGAVIDKNSCGLSEAFMNVGLLSSHRHGPILSGGHWQDKHRIVKTGEKQLSKDLMAITPAHFNPDGFWYKAGGEGGTCHQTHDPKGTNPMDGPMDFEAEISDENRNRVKSADNFTDVHLEFWEREADKTELVDIGDGYTEEKKTAGACILHPFFDKIRSGKWRWRAGCNSTEAEAEAEDGEEEEGGKE